MTPNPFDDEQGAQNPPGSLSGLRRPAASRADGSEASEGPSNAKQEVPNYLLGDAPDPVPGVLERGFESLTRAINAQTELSARILANLAVKALEVGRACECCESSTCADCEEYETYTCEGCGTVLRPASGEMSDHGWEFCADENGGGHDFCMDCVRGMKAEAEAEDPGEVVNHISGPTVYVQKAASVDGGWTYRINEQEVSVEAWEAFLEAAHPKLRAKVDEDVARWQAANIYWTPKRKDLTVKPLLEVFCNLARTDSEFRRALAAEMEGRP